MPIFVWLGAFAAILFGIQALPFGIVLAMFGVPYVIGGLIQLALLALLYEAWTARVPRWLIIIPILVPCAYYGARAYQLSRLPLIASEIGISQVPVAVLFDLQRHSVEMRDSASNYMLARYEIEQIYRPAGRSKISIGMTRSCEKYVRGITKNIPRIASFAMSVDALDKEFCFTFEKDTLWPVSEVIAFDNEHRSYSPFGIGTSVETEIVLLDGVEVGRFSRASAQVLQAFPVFWIGCFPVPRFECGGHFANDRVAVWPVVGEKPPLPYRVSERRIDDLANYLSIPPRSPAEIAAMTRIP